MALSFVFLGLAFGLGVAVLKGDGGGLRYALGNVAAPWLIIPLFAGRSCRTRIRASLLGATVTVASLAGFYAWSSFAYDLVNSHTRMNNLSFVVVGCAAGLVCGATGYGSHAVPGLAQAAVGFILVGEPVVLLALQNVHGATVTESFKGVKVAEIAVGIAVLAWGALRAVMARRTRSVANLGARGCQPDPRAEPGAAGLQKL